MKFTVHFSLVCYVILFLCSESQSQDIVKLYRCVSKDWKTISFFCDTWSQLTGSGWKCGNHYDADNEQPYYKCKSDKHDLVLNDIIFKEIPQSKSLKIDNLEIEDLASGSFDSKTTTSFHARFNQLNNISRWISMPVLTELYLSHNRFSSLTTGNFNQRWNLHFYRA